MRLRDLRARWDDRAAEDARYFIKAERRDWTDADFLASGEADVAAHLDPWLGEGIGHAAALDIGCGIGRLSRALATRFDRVEGIDISPEMIERARTMAPPPPAHLTFTVCDGSGAIPVPPQSVDVAFSYLVLQHVPSTRLVATYVREVGRVLALGGLARLQVNGRRRAFGERLSVGIDASDRVPLLHRKPRLKLDPHSSMGAVVSEAQAHRMARRSGLVLESCGGAGTVEMWMTLRKPGVPRR